MDEIRKRQGWRGKGILRKRRRMSTMMAWESMSFLVFIKVRLDKRVCNALLIFIAPH